MKRIFIISILLLSFSCFANVKDLVTGSFTPGFYSTRNFVVNPSCYANTRGITAIGNGLVEKDTTAPLENSGSCLISGSTLADKIEFELKPFDKTLNGTTCEVRFPYAGNGSRWKAYVLENAVKVSTDFNLVDTASGSKFASLLFPCGTNTLSKKLVIEANAANAFAVRLTNVYVGSQMDLIRPDAVSKYSKQQIITPQTIVTGSTADLNNGNLVIFESPGTTGVTLNNAINGGVYNIFITDGTARTYTFTINKAESGALAIKCSPIVTATTAAKHAMFVFTRIGNNAYCSWAGDL